jgi:hypothetical protein
MISTEDESRDLHEWEDLEQAMVKAYQEMISTTAGSMGT